MGAVAIWTSADLPGLGDQLLGRVIEAELLARLPGWRLNLFAPLGWTRPSVTDGGLVAEPLHDLSPARLAATATLSVACPSFPAGLPADVLAATYGDERAGAAADYFAGGLGDLDEATHPVLPFAIRVADPVPAALVDLLSRAPVVTVRDVESRDRLRAAGLDRNVDVVGHPALLLDRVVDAATLPIRVRQLRQLGVLPDGEYTVLALGAGAVPDADQLRALGDGVVVLPVGPLPAGTEHLPADLVVEDRLAVLAEATAVIATDEHVAAACAGLGIAWTLVDPSGAHLAAAREFGDADQLVDSFDAVVSTRSQDRRKTLSRKESKVALAAQLDRIAEVAERTLQTSGGDLERRMAALAAENHALRHAHWIQRQRMLVERQQLATPLADAMRERDVATADAAALRAANVELARRNEELAARLAATEGELTAWQHTKLVRWTRPLREAYGKARG